jgi:hypothetical protein
MYHHESDVYCGLPDVDDLEVVAEIAEAELRQWRKVRQAVEAQASRDQRRGRLERELPSHRILEVVHVNLACDGDVVRVELRLGPPVRSIAILYRSWALAVETNTLECKETLLLQ